MKSYDGASRVLKFLAAGPASVRPAAMSGIVLLEVAERGTISVAAEVLERLCRAGLMVRTSHSLALSADGAALAAQLAGKSRQASAAGDFDIREIPGETGPSMALVNLAESPLAQLMRRKAKNGGAFLSIQEFEAGERLRSDYTRAHLVPRLGANWEASVSSGKRADGGGIAELTDAALAARMRVEKAITAVGPELSGVLIDVCCFLKGLETVEIERSWPVRSAKIMLKTALGVLSRHYFPTRQLSQRNVLHWGTSDYRPAIAG